MMSNRVAPFILLCYVSALGTAHAQTPPDSASVTAFYREWFASTADPTRYASFYATDGVLLPPNAPPAQGREAIAEWLRRSRANATHTVRPQGISIDEMRFLTPDLVVYRSTLRGQRVPNAGGDAVSFETKYVDLLRRTAGKWEVLQRMWSDNR